MIEPRPYTLEEMSEHYARRHEIRRGLYNGDGANYGYWIRAGMTLDEACEAMTDLIANELEIGPDDRLLECGCGYGASAIRIARQYQPREILATDVTHLRLENARRLVEENGLSDRVRIAFGDAVDLDLPDHSFDKVMAIECAFHFNTRRDFFSEAIRVLSPGGLLAMTDVVPDPSLDLEHYSLDELRQFMGAAAGRYPDENVYSVTRYGELLHQAGFDPVHIYSIKEKVILPLAEHIERVALDSAPEMKEHRLTVARLYREKVYPGSDYIVVRAQKPGQALMPDR